MRCPFAPPAPQWAVAPCAQWQAAGVTKVSCVYKVADDTSTHSECNEKQACAGAHAHSERAAGVKVYVCVCVYARLAHFEDLSSDRRHESYSGPPA